jgi:exosortase
LEIATDRAGLGATTPHTASSSRLLARLPVRGLVLIGSVALAYNYSLETLTRGLSLQTPLAYLSLVPLVALLLGVINFRLYPNLRPIHDRQLDWILGLSLIAVATTIDVLMPSAYSADFWLHRIDMIGLPFFVAGMVSLLYGTRRLWSLRWAILFLLLAWPDPYVTVLAAAIGSSTDIALAAVGASLRVIPVAQPLGNGTFLVTHGADQFSLAVGSACSGINSLVGFVILGAAFNTIFTGGLWRRIVWLAVGLVLVGALNVARIDLIFVAGWAFGESFAIDVLHPVAGIVVFGIGALAMLGIAPLFGLRIPVPPRPDPAATAYSPAGARPTAPRTRPLRIAAPMAVGLMLAVMLAVPDASFAHYDSLVNAFGSPTLGTIDPNGLTITGWHASPSSSFDLATTYFGPHATWERVPFDATVATAGPSSVYLDVIRTDDAGSLAAYGVEACYDFHGFSQVLAGSVDVGAGVQAEVASYRSPIGGTDWSVLWWEWPFDAGGQTRYERLVLLAPVDASGQPGGSTSDASFRAAQSTLESMARSVVRAGMSDPAATSDPAAQQ